MLNQVGVILWAQTDGRGRDLLIELADALCSRSAIIGNPAGNQPLGMCEFFGQFLITARRRGWKALRLSYSRFSHRFGFLFDKLAQDGIHQPCSGALAGPLHQLDRFVDCRMRRHAFKK